MVAYFLSIVKLKNGQFKFIFNKYVSISKKVCCNMKRKKYK
ncbi:hypothetical protein bcere0028_51300 [Bacillus cereus AH1271]|nr:hypothetical protein bcere0028_51300 [Bacillus cereus AH1271]